MSDKTSHKRVNDILLGPLERPALQWLAAHLPGWMTPDVLTVIGIIGSVIIFAAYALTNVHRGYLWLASLGYVINWFGDSLDGTVARYRHIERPKYGFFIDHTVDAFSQVLIFIGLGLTPFIKFEYACLALIGYLLLTVFVYVDTFVSGVFKISYGRFGPTEMRVIAILMNVIIYFWVAPTFELFFGTVSVFDMFALIVAIALTIIFLVSATKRARELAKLEERVTSR